jgi:hypothetical protein
MIPPRLQWCHQIVVTSVCWPKTPSGDLTACSNCTRLLGHEKKRFIMTPDQFRDVVTVAKDFIYESPPCPQGRKNKVLGIFGGEPLLSPYFGEYVSILCEMVPEPEHRGLWTSVDWPNFVGPRYGPAKPFVEHLLNDAKGVRKGYLNWNMHTVEQHCEHHPVLLAIGDVIKDEKRKWQLISECWLNRDWSAAYALDSRSQVKFYFCEVASSFDRVMNLDSGLPVTKGVWNHDLWFVPNGDGILVPAGAYAGQIFMTCNRCGQALPMKAGRRDLDFVDDISPMNLTSLRDVNSPMMSRGDFFEANPDDYQEPKHRHYPGSYIKEGYHKGNKVNER